MASAIKYNNNLHVGNGPGSKSLWYGQVRDMETGEEKYITADDALNSADLSVDSKKIPTDTVVVSNDAMGDQIYGVAGSYFVSYMFTAGVSPKKVLIPGGYNLTCLTYDPGGSRFYFAGTDSDLKPILFYITAAYLITEVHADSGEVVSGALSEYSLDLNSMHTLDNVPSFIWDNECEIGDILYHQDYLYIYFKKAFGDEKTVHFLSDYVIYKLNTDTAHLVIDETTLIPIFRAGQYVHKCPDFSEGFNELEASALSGPTEFANTGYHRQNAETGLNYYVYHLFSYFQGSEKRSLTGGGYHRDDMDILDRIEEYIQETAEWGTIQEWNTEDVELTGEYNNAARNFMLGLSFLLQSEVYIDDNCKIETPGYGLKIGIPVYREYGKWCVYPAQELDMLIGGGLSNEDGISDGGWRSIWNNTTDQDYPEDFIDNLDEFFTEDASSFPYSVEGEPTTVVSDNWGGALDGDGVYKYFNSPEDSTFLLYGRFPHITMDDDSISYTGPDTQSSFTATYTHKDTFMMAMYAKIKWRIEDGEILWNNKTSFNGISEPFESESSAIQQTEYNRRLNRMATTTNSVRYLGKPLQVVPGLDDIFVNFRPTYSMDSFALWHRLQPYKLYSETLSQQLTEFIHDWYDNKRKFNHSYHSRYSVEGTATILNHNYLIGVPIGESAGIFDVKILLSMPFLGNQEIEQSAAIENYPGIAKNAPIESLPGLLQGGDGIQYTGLGAFNAKISHLDEIDAYNLWPAWNMWSTYFQNITATEIDAHYTGETTDITWPNLRIIPVVSEDDYDDIGMRCLGAFPDLYAGGFADTGIGNLVANEPYHADIKALVYADTEAQGQTLELQTVHTTPQTAEGIFNLLPEDDTNTTGVGYETLGLEGTPVEIELILGGSDSGSIYEIGDRIIYKFSLLYDNLQESPLSIAQADEAIVVKGEEVTVKVQINTKLVSHRITHINLYRKVMSDAFIRDETEFSFIDSVNFRPIERWTAITEETIVEESAEGESYTEHTGVYYFTINPKSSLIRPKYSSITGISETLYSNTLNYELSEAIESFLFVAGAHIPHLSDDVANYVFRSKSSKFSQFDWSSDYQVLPEKPIALKGFMGRLYCFTSNTLYKLNPATLEVEDSYDGTGCFDKDSVIVTEYGMCFADKDNIYLHDGNAPQIISRSIATSSSYSNYGWQDVDKLYVKLGFDNQRKSFLVFFAYEIPYNVMPDFSDALVDSDASIDVLNINLGKDPISTRTTEDPEDFTVVPQSPVGDNIFYRCWAYNLANKRWDLLETHGFVTAVAQHPDGSCVYGVRSQATVVAEGYEGSGITSTVYKYMGAPGNPRSWSWCSKDLTMSGDTQEKRLKNIKVESNSEFNFEEIRLLIDGNYVGKNVENESLSTSAIETVIKANGSKKFKTLQLKLGSDVGIAGAHEVGAIGIIYKPKSIR